MLSISQTSNFYHCLEWIPSESGIEVVKFQKIKSKLNIDNDNLIKSIIDDFNPISKNDSNALSISLDIENIQISSIEIEPKIDVEKYISWYENKVLGSHFIENFDIFYYPIINNNLVTISIDKLFRKKLIKSSKSAGYNLVDINVGIFSAQYSIKQINKLNDLKNYLLWKVDKKNIHYLSFYLNDCFSFMMKIKKRTNEIIVLNEVGDINYKNNIVDYVRSILFESKQKSNFSEKVFIYQSGNDKNNIEFAIKNNIELLDISNFFNNKMKAETNKENNKYKFFGYIENATSLKKIDV